jgi:ABC-type Mn2+/Zn2+ transport system permease subunit
MLWLLLILPGLLCAYFILLRPILHAIPVLRSFYDEADTFWGKAWALTGRSATVIWGLFLTGFGTVFQWLDPIASALGDPDLKAQVMEALKNNPQYFAYIMIGISAITIVARLRSVGKS